MITRIRENLFTVLPIAIIFGLWITLADAFRVVFGSVKLLGSFKSLALLLTYGCITTQASVIGITIIISVIATLADPRGGLTPLRHSGRVVGILVFIIATTAGMFAIGNLASSFHPMDPRFSIPFLGVLAVGVILGRLSAAYICRTYNPAKWAQTLAKQYALTVGVSVFVFGLFMAQFNTLKEEIYRTGFASPTLENMLFYPIFFVGAAAVWGIVRDIAGRLAKRSGSWVIALILLSIIAPMIIYLRHAPPNNPDKHNPNPGDRDRNIMLISMDTVRYDMPGFDFNTRIQTPNIDSLAAESVIFDDCIVPIPLTLPSHTSMLTGLTPRHHGLRVQDYHLDPSILTLAERLSDKGFTCGAMISMAILRGANSNLNMGFQYYDDFWVYDNQSKWWPQEVKFFIGGKIINKIFTGRGGTPGRYERKAEQTVDSAINWMDKVKGDDFFCFLHLFDAHWDYNAPEPYTTMYDPNYNGELRFDRDLKNYIWENKLQIDQRDIDHLKARYEGEITYADAQLGRVFSRLKELGLWDKTMIILTADHGESFEHDYFFGHADRVYQSCIHVPLIIKPFGGASGQRTDVLCSNYDFFPTICTALGISIPDNLDGKNLMDFVNGPAIPGDQVRPYMLSESYAFANYNIQHYGKVYTIIRDHKKLIYSPYAFPYAPIYQYYDLSVDAGETNNLYDPDNPEIQSLESLLDRWVAEDEAPKHGIPGRVERENLKSLQYINN